ncbi:MAG: GTP-binding protein [Gemmataceae bacterium]
MIPVNVFTGFLNVGKTTAIADLLKRKPATERWAVLQNEFGDATLDGADESDGVSIREIGGGCVCCAAAPFLPVALHLLLLEANPDRLLIEASGLGHPERLLETLRLNYSDRLDVRATVNLVDPSVFPAMLENGVFFDQIAMADVLVFNKMDHAEPGILARFQDWANGLAPPKELIAATNFGRLEPAWLDLPANPAREPL